MSPLLARLTSFTHPTPVDDRQQSALEFVNRFERTTNGVTLPFHKDSYMSALKEAKDSGRCLLVIIHSYVHDDTEKYSQNVLASDMVVEAIKANNVLVWGGSATTSEGYQISTELHCTEYPFMALISETRRSPDLLSMHVLGRLSGYHSPEEVVAFIQRLTAKYARIIESIRESEMQAESLNREREAARQLRAEQDSAYERSLAADRDRLRRLDEERAARLELERQQQLEEQRRLNARQIKEQWKRYIASTLPPEPEATNKDSTRLSIRLPDGSRVIRRFSADTKIIDLYNFVECYPLLHDKDQAAQDAPDAPPADYEHVYDFILVSPMPRHEFPCDKDSYIRDENLLWPSGSLIAELLGDVSD
ncbi:hypothetical protein CANCADRAFT_28981 [Tortispora caseinolytica NRRL Y-17796]|uniref:UBX domain-containing protein n=1 Tax=Tortispora caseinolytica NRRL Y-17796 TaxID=767744 RepID=A0A1E4TD60_9ASCO|nr:hypothetical protein CANCADRAFT_28981 [Tortispora caseinolytica NRRL Y-17796]